MRTSATVLLAVIALVLAGAPPARSLGSLPDTGVGIVFAPDGNLWHTTERSLGATSLRGQSFHIDLPEDADAGALALADDALWFIHGRDALGRLAAGGMPTVIGDLPVRLNDLAVGPDGNVWFAAEDRRKGGGRGVIGRVAEGGDVSLFGEGVTGEPQAIAAGADGTLWFTEPKAQRVGRITTDGFVTEVPVEGRPTALAVGSDLAVWFTDAGGSIGRVAPDLTVTRYEGAGHRPGDIALGADGQLWYTLHHGIGQIRTDGTITTWDLRSASPVSVAAGPDAAMYYTDARSAELGRFDVRTEPGADAPEDKPKPKPKPKPEQKPKPKVKETAVVAPEEGEVRVRTPGGDFTQLDTTRAIPMGSVVDTRHGAVTLVTETEDGSQSGTFRGGRFEVRQRQDGHTDIHLRGRLDCARAGLATTARKKRKRRKVWGSDSGGAFSTHGRDSVTTVRGTEWLTVDTCRGTRTRVKSGEVVVRERRTGERHVVKAGQSHFVRHRR